MTETEQTEIEQTETDLAEPETKDEPVLIDGTVKQRDDAKQRSRDCNAAIRKVLTEYHCSIIPMLVADQVGGGPLTRMLIDATYWVRPEVIE